MIALYPPDLVAAKTNCAHSKMPPQAKNKPVQQQMAAVPGAVSLYKRFYEKIRCILLVWPKTSANKVDNLTPVLASLAPGVLVEDGGEQSLANGGLGSYGPARAPPCSRS